MGIGRRRRRSRRRHRTVRVDLEHSVTYMVQYNFTGFFMPVENPPVMNRLKAGNGVPIKFSLNGNHGLSIIEAGYPKVQVIACDSLATLSDVAETISAGSSSLSYDLYRTS